MSFLKLFVTAHVALFRATGGRIGGRCEEERSCC